MKLITKAIAPVLMAAYEHSAETGESGKDVIAKYFTPWAGASWHITEGMPVDSDGAPTTIEKAKDWHLFGFANLGDPTMAELGYVMLSDLEGLKGPGGLAVERDLYYFGHKIADVIKDAKMERWEIRSAAEIGAAKAGEGTRSTI